MFLLKATILVLTTGYIMGRSEPNIPLPPPPATGLGPQCDVGWNLYRPGMTCVKVINSKMTWDDARTRCKAVFADLVSIEDAAFNRFVTGLVSKNERYWIGLNDMDQDGTYHWLDYPLPATWYNWLTNPGANQEDCAQLVGDQDGKWSEKSCKAKRFYICQRYAVEILN